LNVVPAVAAEARALKPMAPLPESVKEEVTSWDWVGRRKIRVHCLFAADLWVDELGIVAETGAMKNRSIEEERM